MWHKVKIKRYYKNINGVKVEVVKQWDATVELEEVEVNEDGESREFIEASKKLK